MRKISLNFKKNLSKSRGDHPNLPCDIVLSKSVQAMNDNVGPHGLFTSLLVFGVLPKFPDVSTYESKTKKAPEKNPETARKENENCHKVNHQKRDSENSTTYCR